MSADTKWRVLTEAQRRAVEHDGRTFNSSPAPAPASSASFSRFSKTPAGREERVPNGRGEVVFFNLGKFNQVITDYETIHHSKPTDKYDSFAGFLRHRAETAYPEGWQDNQYANPDAVRIMTVHQAKGMEWPVAFLPALLRNRRRTKPAPRAGVFAISMSADWRLSRWAIQCGAPAGARRDLSSHAASGATLRRSPPRRR